MRVRVKTYTIIGQDIQLPFQLTIEDIRLVCNETQKKVLCSSMLKDKVTISGDTISIDPNECVLNPNDQITIEIDFGDNLDALAKEGTLLDGINDILAAIAGISSGGGGEGGGTSPNLYSWRFEQNQDGPDCYTVVLPVVAGVVENPNGTVTIEI